MHCSFVTRKIIGAVFDQIQAQHFAIGHLKFFLETTDWKEKISFTTTSTSADVKIRDQDTDCVTLLINANIFSIRKLNLQSI